MPDANRCELRAAMNLDRFLNLLASLFGAMGSIYVLRGILAFSPDLMARLSRTPYGFNAAQVNALASQKADSIIGVVLIAIALTLALVNVGLVPSEVRVFARRDVALAAALALAAIVYLILVPIGHGVHKHQKLAVGRIITADYIDRLLAQGRLDRREVPSLLVYAQQLLELQVGSQDQPRQIIERVVSALGRELPADFDLSDVEKQ